MANPILIIDPGHGGIDPGATSRFGHEEDFTLKISLYQYRRFQELGVPVAITRTTDVTLEENERVAAVKNSGATYCISNHLNAGGGDRAEVIYSIYNDGELANKIKEELLAAGQTTVKVYSRRGSHGDYYYMHRRTGPVETNIVEYCFIDNEADFTHFNEHWQAYAEATVKAFCEHIGHPYTTKAKLPYKVIIPNVAFWQAQGLVIEFEQRGYKCYGKALETYGPNENPSRNDPYWFVIETDYENAKALVIELQTRGYDRTYGEQQ